MDPTQEERFHLLAYHRLHGIERRLTLTLGQVYALMADINRKLGLDAPDEIDIEDAMAGLDSEWEAMGE